MKNVFRVCTSLILMLLLHGAWGQILIGQTAGFTGVVAASTQEASNGAKLYIDWVNASGGVHGQKIELIQMDDKFDPKLTAENTRVLIEDKKVLALVLDRGTPNTEAMLPLLDKYGVALIAPSTGAMIFHKPLKRYVFNVRSTYQHEAEKAIEHQHTVGVSKIAIIHADDSFGLDALEGAMHGFDKFKGKPTIVIKADRNKPDFVSIVAEIVKNEPQSVLWIGSGTAVVDGIKALRAAGSSVPVLTLSNNASSGFIKGLGKDGPGVIVSQVFPAERALSYGMIRQAQDLAKANGGTGVSPAMLEGFAGAKVLVEALRRAGAHPSRESIVTALNGMKNFDLGGLVINYSPTNHTGLDFSDLSIISRDGKFVR